MERRRKWERRKRVGRSTGSAGAGLHVHALNPHAHIQTVPTRPWQLCVCARVPPRAKRACVHNDARQAVVPSPRALRVHVRPLWYAPRARVRRASSTRYRT
eukprot:6190740-Pleurochrysis_carterae.AAC.1